MTVVADKLLSPSLSENVADIKTLAQQIYSIVISGSGGGSGESIGETMVGNLNELETNDKTSIVAAINEICQGIEVLTNLPTVVQLAQYMEFMKPLFEGEGAGLHNSIYRGKYLGDYVTADQWTTIQQGIFSDLWIGDFWTINGVNWRIADFDYYYNTYQNSDYLNTHHIVIVPDNALYDAQMYTTNVTTSGYYGSAMYTSNLATAKSTVNSAFGSAHILNHYKYYTTASSSGRPTSTSRYSNTVDLMTEQMVYGSRILGAMPDPAGTSFAGFYTYEKSQLNLFRLRPDFINIKKGYWLRDIVSASSFACVIYYGFAIYNSASSSLGVRPAFAIAA